MKQQRVAGCSNTATVAETANHYKLIVDGRKWDNLELNTK